MPYYMTLASSGGLRYGSLVGTTVTDPDRRRHELDYTIDPREFQEALEATLG